MISKTAAAALAAAITFVAVATVLASPAAALTQEECQELIEEGEEAREDLQNLIEKAAEDPSLADGADDPETASYLTELIASTQINEFGFVDAVPGEPLELCLPKGTTQLTLFSDPIVLWEGLATTDAFPVTVTIPVGLDCGDHELRATGDGVDQRATVNIDENCTTAAGVGGVLPRTGAEIGQWVAVALALIAIGYSIVRSRRARMIQG
jgi:hypothetical protein